MERLLFNLVLLPFLFAFIAARNPERLSYGLAWRLIAGGATLFLLAGALGKAFGQTFAHTYFVFDRTNDMAMGVILGASFLYAALLCFTWLLSSRYRGEA